MATRIKNRLQATIGIIVSVLSHQVALAQPAYLEPELSSSKRLNSSAVRVISQNKDKRIWMGTDNGLEVLHDFDRSYKTIKDRIGNQPVWALAFYKDFALIGTRFGGVYICDLKVNKIVQHFDSSKVGLCRRFRVINDTVFLATKDQPVYFTYRNDSWQMRKLYANVEAGFVTDFVYWQHNVHASVISYGSFHPKNLLRKLQGDSLVTVPDIYSSGNQINIRGGLNLSLATDGITLYEGGDGYLNEIDKQKRVKVQFLHNPVTKINYPVWDIVMIGHKPALTLGNPDNTQEGMILISPVFDLNKIRSDFYGQSLYYDGENRVLWAGTGNRGAFGWRFPEDISLVQQYDPDAAFKMQPFTKDTVLLFNKDRVIVKDLNTGKEKVIYDRGANKQRDFEVADALALNRKIIVRNYSELQVFSYEQKEIKLVFRKKIIESITRILSRDDEIYLFSSYHDVIGRYNVKSGMETLIAAPSNQVRILSVNENKALYHSTYTGFYVFDSTFHSLHLPYPVVESFTLSGDTLWILNAGNVKAYKIDYTSQKAVFLFENDIKGKMTDWMPSWISGIEGSVYCGNNKGFLRLDHQNGNPVSYIYLGNYSQGQSPEVKGGFMFLNHGNYITRIEKRTIEVLSKARNLHFGLSTNSSLFERRPFSILFKSNDYFSLHYSLKRIEFWESGQLKFTYHSTGDKVEFPQGLPKGNYKVKLFSNNHLVQQMDLRASIPLTSDPLFYIGILFFILLFLFLLFKYLLNKRSYERHILENRLQLLKQNLNPHFIFNSLNLIYSLVLQKKNEAAIRTINHFSDLHRYYLDNISKQRIPLRDELMFIESYLKMESERVQIDDLFSYEIPSDIRDSMAGREVPPMILQPLVENAVKYAANKQGVRKIWIDVKEDGDMLIVGIENTIDISMAKTAGKGLGLKLVQERVDIFNKAFQEKAEFISKVQPLYSTSGYRCELSFPR